MKIVKETNSLCAVGPYSLAIEVGDLILLSGQIGIDKEFKLVEGGTSEEFKKIIANTKDILKKYNLSLENIVQIRNYLTKLDDFSIVNELYKEIFKSPYPVRTTFQVAGIPLKANIEVEIVASKSIKRVSKY